MKICDLFAGIGGLSAPFVDMGCKVVFASEKDKHAAHTYNVNHGLLPDGDITLINEKNIPDFDLLLAGFPCQPFSVAGKKKGLNDTRGTLFFDIARILAEKKPKAFLLENVPGLLSDDKGRTMRIIYQTLEELGYNVSYEILNAHDFGTCQRRRRLFIVGIYTDNFLYNFPFPKGKANTKPLACFLEDAPTEKANLSNGLLEWMQGRYHKKHSNSRKSGFAPVWLKLESISTPTLLASKRWKKGDEALIQEGKPARELTPRECARLQGIPDNFILHDNDAQAFKQIGNSVHQGTIKAIANVLLEQINQHMKDKKTC